MSVYVMSDIHGLSERFFAMLEKIAFSKEDHLYVLGDVVDRGKDGVVLLYYIMQQPNITLLMGNHEYMMLQYYETISSEFIDVKVIERWHRNGCDTTLAQMQEYSYEQQEEMVQYLRSLPLCISDLRVNDQMFYLVHGAPVKSIREGRVYLQNDYLKLFTVEDFVWQRVSAENVDLEDRTLIVGHTITAFYQDAKPYRVYADKDDFKQARMLAIDCGCACDNQNTQLACIRLDDFSVFYT